VIVINIPMKSKILQLIVRSGIWKNSLFMLAYKRFYKARYKTSSDLLLININDQKMFVDINDLSITPHLLVGNYEEPDVLKKTLRPGMTFVDVGANIGFYSLEAARIVENGKVYAFEPIPTTYDILVKNIKVNNVKTIIPVNMAVSDQNGKTQFFWNKRRRGDASMFKNKLASKHDALEVDTTTLDSYFKEAVGNMDVDFIKIDVEGAEALVIKGADSLLKSSKVKILLEFCPFNLRKAGSDPFDLLSKLKNYGFHFWIVSRLSRFRDEVEISEIKSHFEGRKLGSGNYVNLFLQK